MTTSASFLLPAGWEKTATVMQQSCGQEKETRGSEGVRREVADSERKIPRRGS